MNLFRLVGDLSHLLAIVLLLLKIWKTRSCAGISGKSQALFLIVFVTRYLDLLTNFVSLYNTVMKLFFIGSAAGTVYLMYHKFKVTLNYVNQTTFLVCMFVNTVGVNKNWTLVFVHFSAQAASISIISVAIM